MSDHFPDLTRAVAVRFRSLRLLERIDDERIVTWIEERLLDFLDAYLRIDRGAADFNDEVAADPVCGMKIVRSSAAAIESYGHPYFLCSLSCAELFRAQPKEYIPEPKSPRRRVWANKPPEQRAAVEANRRRTRGARGKRSQRERSERVERSFAHLCETGGARRSWLTGIENVRKQYLIAAAAHNLGVVMRKLFKMGTPRSLQTLAAGVAALILAVPAVGQIAKIAFHALQRSQTDIEPQLPYAMTAC